MNITSKWIGELKERRVFTLTLIRAPQKIQGEWGDSYLHKFLDDEGNHFATFTKQPLAFDDGSVVNTNQIILLKGTITKYNNFNNIRETILSRVKCVGLWKDVYMSNKFDEFLRDEGIL
jgi:hypothetical protein